MHDMFFVLFFCQQRGEDPFPVEIKDKEEKIPKPIVPKSKLHKTKERFKRVSFVANTPSTKEKL